MPFQTAVREALSSAAPLEATAALFRHPLFRQAHPTPEHFLPLVLAVAATDGADVKTAVMDEVDTIGLGWGMWRWALKA